MLEALTKFPKPVRWLLLLLAGLCNNLAFAPYDYAFIPFITLPILLLGLKLESHWRGAAFAGWIYGLGWFGAGISWVHVSVATYGGLPLIVSVALMALLVGYLSLFPALTAALLMRLTPNDQHWWLSFPIFWFISEWLRSLVLTGFPWLSLGYSQFTTPLQVLAPVIGEIGITFVLCLVAVLFVQLILSERRLINTSALVLIGLLTWALQYTQWTEPNGQHKKVSLVQGNIRQDLKWAPENDWPTYMKYLDISRPYYADADLIVWPEAAIPMLEPSAIEDLAHLDKALAMNHTALITGIIDFNFESKAIYNALITLGLKAAEDEKGQYFYPSSNRYYKHHLLPIGEFVPFEDFLRPLAPLFDLPMSSFTRGAARQPNLRANGLNLAAAMCYEIIFPRLLRQNIQADTDMILTVSNDAWFGRSAGPHQHMQIAQMRALEFGRPLLRATNNGVTAITDEKGQIIAQLPQFIDGVLSARVSLVSGITPYLRYGDWPLWLFSVFGLLYFLSQRLAFSRVTKLPKIL